MHDFLERCENVKRESRATDVGVASRSRYLSSESMNLSLRFQELATIIAYHLFEASSLAKDTDISPIEFHNTF